MEIRRIPFLNVSQGSQLEMTLANPFNPESRLIEMADLAEREREKGEIERKRGRDIEMRERQRAKDAPGTEYSWMNKSPLKQSPHPLAKQGTYFRITG